MALRDKIIAKEARVGIVGLGYVGLPLAVAIAEAGFPVVGIDLAAERIDAVNAGRSYIDDVTDTELASLVHAGRLRATGDYAVVGSLDVVLICVPTPLNPTRDPDVSYIVAATEGIVPHLHREQLIVLESTTYPGTTEEVVLPALERSGLKVGIDFFLAFSPERVDPGNKTFRVRNTPKVIGGVTSACGDMAESFYQQVINRVVRMSSPRAAEMTKLFENVFRVVNVAVVNELAILCDRMGLNVWEIVDAAATKPYGFMSFYPGPGVGGHCLSENELLFVKNGHGLTCVRIGDYFAQLEYQYPGVARKVTGVTILEPEGIDILSFDLERREACYKPLQALSRREYRGTMVDIATDDRRSLCVTDGHPMVVWTANLPQIKRASDLRPGDELIVPTQWPDVVSIHQEIDLISHLAADEIGRTRVVPKHGHFKDYRAQLTLHLKALDIDPHEIYRSNRMPLRVYLELEQCNTMPITRRDIMLRTGHGSSWNAISAVIAIDEEFARLIGYYLSEGCITTDKSLRTRFVFNSNEREYIDDVCHILGKLGLRYSKRKDKVWNSLHIKVSSNLFARLIRDVLGCGTCSTEMQIPGVLLGSPEPIRLALLSGLLRGDGDVDLEQQTRHYYYKKKQRFYDHSINVATVGYFSSSPRLFQQTVALAQGLGFVPTFKKNKPYLRFYGQHQLARLLSLFEGAKRADLESYARNRRKQMPTKSFTAHGNFATVKIRQISQTEGAHNVYSAEVEDTHTFVTSYGIVTHNCIPVDPFYLTWKARQYDFNTRFIELAGETNLMMPYQVRERVIRALNWQGRALNGAKVLILGVAYKRDIADVRESPAFKVIELLRRDGVEVVYNDPHVPEFQHSDLAMRSVPLTDELLASADCVLILTDHRAYDYDSIVANARVLVDTRNATKGVKRNREKIVLL